MKTTAKREEVIQAIQIINEKFNYKTELNTDRQLNAKWYNFTLKSKSGIPGARVSYTGRNIAKASWHAHGYLFDEILRLNPEAVIISGGKRIDKYGGNWEDKNIGAFYSPCYFSETSIL